MNYCGNLYIVLFEPDDMVLLKNGPSNRRRFLDVMISQLKKNYLFSLNQYMKILEQRNNYLRQIKYENKPEEMLEIWDESLSEYGYIVWKYRNEFIEKIKEKVNYFHMQMTGQKEKITIEYNSTCSAKQKYLNVLKKNRKIDIIKGYTINGIHRDDFSIQINGRPVNVYGSQGQQRTTIISLKLSELEIINEEVGERPILLLDDFMSELDDKRISNFLENIKDNQIIITCTNQLKLEKTKGSFYKVENGKIYIT